LFTEATTQISLGIFKKLGYTEHVILSRNLFPCTWKLVYVYANNGNKKKTCCKKWLMKLASHDQGCGVWLGASSFLKGILHVKRVEGWWHCEILKRWKHNQPGANQLILNSSDEWVLWCVGVVWTSQSFPRNPGFGLKKDEVKLITSEMKKQAYTCKQSETYRDKIIKSLCERDGTQCQN